MSTTPTSLIQPEALLATTPAQAPIDQLNAELRACGLCLPVEPLERGLSLATLVERNAGGRRRMRYGTIGRYLRAAEVRVGEGPTLTFGGPTLKRATGYGLNRALVGGTLAAPEALVTVTLSLRPLPAARMLFAATAPSFTAAQQLATALLHQGLAMSALPFIIQADGSVALLVELEGSAAVIARQGQVVLAQATRLDLAINQVDDQAWGRWETLAATCQPTLAISLPRAALAGIAELSHAHTTSQGRAATLWGDLGAGALSVSLATEERDGTVETLLQIYEQARQAGGALSTEPGMPQWIRQQWQSEAAERGAVNLSNLNNAPSSISHTLSPAPEGLLTALRAVVGERHVVTRPDELGCYLRDASIARAEGLPLAVVLPGNTAEVAAVVRLAADYRLPVVTRGAGSGLAGGSTPTSGALVVGMSRMQRFSIDVEQMCAVVEGGVVTAELQRAAEAVGLFYPPDPSSLPVSTMGGNIACNAGGPRCLKYGVTGDYVVGLTAVLADGTVMRVGDGLEGQSPDADLLQLLVGSEGTLALITEASLRLVRLPASKRTTMAVFDRLDDACATVEQIMADGIIPAGLEIMDDSTIAVVDDYLRLGLPRDAGAILLLLTDGEPEEVAADAERLAELCRAGGARSAQTARSEAEEASLWRGRRAIAPALARLRPNRLGEDICVPVNQIAECVRRIKQIAVRHEQPIVVFGHAGDGNLHPNILFDGRDPAQVERVWRAAGDIFTVALELGGTLSGEHGIGTLKRPFMRAALGDELIALQTALKARFDPEGRLNPGKVLP